MLTFGKKHFAIISDEVKHSPQIGIKTCNGILSGMPTIHASVYKNIQISILSQEFCEIEHV